MQRTQETDVRVSQISLVSREYEGAHFQQVLTARRERTMLVVLRYTPKKKIFQAKKWSNIHYKIFSALRERDQQGLAVRKSVMHASHAISQHSCTVHHSNCR